MSDRKRETTFYSGVNAKLPKEIYQEKMFNPLRGGTPDMYYELRRNLWCEYKYEPLPARDTSIVRCTVTELQKWWLDRNHANGHKPIVIVGTHLGRVPMGAIFTSPRQWSTGMPCGSFKKLLMTQRELVDEIARRVS